MIILGLLDFLSVWLGGLISLIPPIPAEWNQVIGWIHTGGAYLGGALAKLSPIVPWFVFQSIVGVWMGLLVFWGAMLLLRLVLWIVGR